MPKAKGKNPDKLCQVIFIFETHNTHEWKVLISERFFTNELICCSSITGSLDMSISEFKKKKHNLGTKSLFPEIVLKIAFQLFG